MEMLPPRPECIPARPVWRIDSDYDPESPTQSKRRSSRRSDAKQRATHSRHTLDRLADRATTNHLTIRQADEFEMNASSRTHSSPRLSDLKYISTIGTGSWGSVFLVRNKKGRPENQNNVTGFLALKAVEKRAYRDLERNDQHEDRAEVKEFKNNERRTLSTLPWNPFITNIFNAYYDQRNTYFLLEYAPRGSLHDLMLRHRGPLPTDLARFYFSNLVLALEFLNSHGISHRDIKAENILIGADGYAMLADFGSAIYVREVKSVDRIGTMIFYSPELIDREPKTIEARYAADWWAAACMLFEMLTHRECFPQSLKTLAALKDRIMSRRLNWPPTFKDDIARDLLTRMFEPSLHTRLGCRTVQSESGNGVINKDLRRHEWFKEIDWERLKARLVIAPTEFTRMPPVPSVWDLDTVPEQRKYPGMNLKRRHRSDQAETGPSTRDRPAKRQRTERPAANPT